MQYNVTLLQHIINRLFSTATRTSTVWHTNYFWFGLLLGVVLAAFLEFPINILYGIWLKDRVDKDKKNKRKKWGWTIISLGIIAVMILGLLILSYTIEYITRTVYNFRSSIATFQPFLSPAGKMVNYKIEFCNDNASTNPLIQIRIYENENYTNFKCNSKKGWNLYYAYTTIYDELKNFCSYHPINPTYFINPGECEIFDFDAHTPESGCEMIWFLESRFDDGFYIFHEVYTVLETCQSL